jgi:hypothetical protein
MLVTQYFIVRPKSNTPALIKSLNWTLPCDGRDCGVQPDAPRGPLHGRHAALALARRGDRRRWRHAAKQHPVCRGGCRCVACERSVPAQGTPRIWIGHAPRDRGPGGGQRDARCDGTDGAPRRVEPERCRNAHRPAWAPVFGPGTGRHAALERPRRASRSRGRRDQIQP